MNVVTFIFMVVGLNAVFSTHDDIIDDVHGLLGIIATLMYTLQVSFQTCSRNKKCTRIANVVSYFGVWYMYSLVHELYLVLSTQDVGTLAKTTVRKGGDRL